MKTLLFLSLAFYFVGLIQAALIFLRKPRLPLAITLVSAIGGFCLHSAALVLRGMQVARCPIALQPELFAFLGWTLALYYLVASFWNRNRLLVSYIMPVTFLCTLTAVLLPMPELAPVGLKSFSSFLFPVHVSLVLFAYAAFFITFLTGLMYILQERELKLKRFSLMFGRLPALDTCDEISYKSMSVGFVLLTLGIVTGIIWSGRRDGIYWHGDPIEIISMLTWLIYLFMIHYRVTAGWRGRRAAIVAIIGFAFVLFSLVSLKYLGGVHVFQLG